MRGLLAAGLLLAAYMLGYHLGWSDKADELERRRQEREAMA